MNFILFCWKTHTTSELSAALKKHLFKIDYLLCPFSELKEGLHVVEINIC